VLVSRSVSVLMLLLLSRFSLMGLESRDTGRRRLFPMPSRAPPRTSRGNKRPRAESSGEPMSVNEGVTMSRTTIHASVATAVAFPAVALVLVVQATAARDHVGVGFNAPSIAGFPGDFSGGTVFLSGGGAYDPTSAFNAEPGNAFVHSNG